MAETLGSLEQAKVFYGERSSALRSALAARAAEAKGGLSPVDRLRRSARHEPLPDAVDIHRGGGDNPIAKTTEIYNTAPGSKEVARAVVRRTNKTGQRMSPDTEIKFDEKGNAFVTETGEEVWGVGEMVRKTEAKITPDGTVVTVSWRGVVSEINAAAKRRAEHSFTKERAFQVPHEQGEIDEVQVELEYDLGGALKKVKVKAGQQEYDIPIVLPSDMPSEDGRYTFSHVPVGKEPISIALTSKVKLEGGMNVVSLSEGRGFDFQLGFTVVPTPWNNPGSFQPHLAGINIPPRYEPWSALSYEQIALAAIIRQEGPSPYAKPKATRSMGAVRI